MPEGRASPSGGLRAVYGATGAPTSVEGDAPTCPECGEACPRVRVDRYRCPEHGTFAASDRARPLG